MSQYNKIAKKYIKAVKDNPCRIYVFDHTFLSVIGDPSGLRVLDLGCGSGRYTRKLKELGASKVVGVDNSEEMLKLAEEATPSNLGIQYIKQNAFQLGRIGEFDIITAGLFLHYAKTKNELDDICSIASQNLVPGGRLVALISDPFHPIHDSRKFDAVTELKSQDLKDGSELLVTLYRQGKPAVSFTHSYWSAEAYYDSLNKAGFSKPKWHNLRISEEGRRNLGDKYWEDFKGRGIIVLEAVKR